MQVFVEMKHSKITEILISSSIQYGLQNTWTEMSDRTTKEFKGKKNATTVQSKTLYYFKKLKIRLLNSYRKWGLKCDFHLSRNISTKH